MMPYMYPSDKPTPRKGTPTEMIEKISRVLELRLCTEAEALTDMTAEAKRQRKLARKQRDELNRINRLVPGLKRVYDLENLIERFASDREAIARDLAAMAADGETTEGVLETFDADILFLRRLAWDLHAMRKALGRNNRQAGRGWDPEAHAGPRP